MSVNRLQTIRPLLFADDDALSLDVSVLNTSAGLILTAGCGHETCLGLALMEGRDFALLACVEPVGLLHEDDVHRLLDGGIDGVVLTGCRGRADIQKLDVMLRVAEARIGLPANRTRIYAEYGAAPEGLLSPHTLAGCSQRLEGLIFNGSALAKAVGCKEPASAAHQGVAAPVLAGRANVVLRAHEAGIRAYEVLPPTADAAATRWALSQSRNDGFASVVCRSPEQAVIAGSV
ncbi:aldolase [Ensifer sp. ENS03]|uniref:aldolase n=1 Tax=Ensifer TaxID=106591 RepID=UPI00178704B6|nr:aldolase [Ensifer sp. ENS03]MBD9559422.1 aldolase [Ensifer sp. ENS03]